MKPHPLNWNLHHQHHLEVYDFDDPFPNTSVFGRGSFLCGCGISNGSTFSSESSLLCSRLAVVDKLYVWGGNGVLGESVATSIVHHYDPDSETWNTNTCEGPHPPGISNGACASAGHHLYIVWKPHLFHSTGCIASPARGRVWSTCHTVFVSLPKNHGEHTSCVLLMECG